MQSFRLYLRVFVSAQVLWFDCVLDVGECVVVVVSRMAPD